MVGLELEEVLGSIFGGGRGPGGLLAELLAVPQTRRNNNDANNPIISVSSTKSTDFAISTTLSQSHL